LDKAPGILSAERPGGEKKWDGLKIPPAKQKK
jgi:hypothetical protein